LSIQEEKESVDNFIKKRTDISIDLEGINRRVSNYIKDILILIEKEIGTTNILSIFLFGSQIPQNNEQSKISDCDLLIVFKNNISKKAIQNLEKYFISLEIKHEFREPRSSFLINLLGDIQYHTGIFKSHFLTIEKYWKKRSFYRIFNVNYLFSKLFAPKRLVMGSVLKNSILLYGQDIRGEIENKIQVTTFDLAKSLIMNTLISFFSYLMTPFESLNSIKYQLEAVKWSLRASDYYLFESTDSLHRVIKRRKILKNAHFRKKDEKYYNKFIYLRDHPNKAYLFMFQSFIKIFDIHITTIQYKKIISKIKS
jgi:predicted nucleotidyltransferase